MGSSNLYGVGRNAVGERWRRAIKGALSGQKVRVKTCTDCKINANFYFGQAGGEGCGKGKQKVTAARSGVLARKVVRGGGGVNVQSGAQKGCSYAT